MKVLFNWLKEFVPIEVSPQETAEVLLRLGFEVSGLQNLGGALQGVVVGEVQDVRKHPNADRLSLCKVSDGSTVFSVVCGASNVAVGQRVALARVGAVLPKGDTIAAAKLRGVDSQGMICSSEELGLSSKSEGILTMSPNSTLGEDVRKLLALDDTVLDVDVTPNRGDVLSVLGIARELSVALGVPLKNPEPRARELEPYPYPTPANETPELCSRYVARFIRNARVGPSPEWMVHRLNHCGIRSINNIVDITNYVMLELGQPLHAFDAVKLKGGSIRIRMARGGETLLTLEGKTVDLLESMLVIADAEKPVALAGIIGGQDSAVGPETQDLLLESATFSPPSVRQTRTRLGLSTESSYRFERGSDWNRVALASLRAAQLMQELTGGVVSKPSESPTRPFTPQTVRLRTERVRQHLGIEAKESFIADILRRLGCTINTGTQQLHVTIPSWRQDLVQEADLIEEIARVQGYETLPSRTPVITMTTVQESPFWRLERHAAHILTGLGLSEAYNDSFLSSGAAASFAPGLGQGETARPLAVSNPLSQDSALLRISLLPGLLKSALTNFHRQGTGVSLFEIGRIFYLDTAGAHESRRLGLLLGGTVQAAHWRQKNRSADFYELAGVLDAFLNALKVPSLRRQPCTAAAFHPKRSVTLLSGERVIGWMGEIHPLLRETLDTRESLAAAELDLSALLGALSSSAIYVPISPFPPVRRDLSFILSEIIPYEKVLKAVRVSAGSLLEFCELIDLYRGAAIGVEKKSLTVSLTFRHKERTLTDTEVEKAMAAIKQALQKQCEAAIRQ